MVYNNPKIGVVGCGFVGGAVFNGLKNKIENQILTYDINGSGNCEKIDGVVSE